MLTLIENGEVYAPEPRGRQSVLIVDRRIGRIGDVDGRALERTGLDLRVVDATGCVVTPGFIDPHQHLLGGSGESGFSSQTPMIFLSEIICAGITTVVGVLGVDTTMKTLAGLLAHVKGLKGEGLTAYLWSGGYNVPPTSVTKSLRDDMMFIDEVVGAGEVAIADKRGLCPQAPELAKVVLDTHVGGLLSGKAGVTHFHVGEDEQRLKRLRELLDGDFAITPEMLYPTHVERSEELMDEAIELARLGSHADIDTVEGDLARWVCYWLDHGGDPSRLTISSDAGAASPAKFFSELRAAVVEHRVPLEQLLPLVTSNTATVLKLGAKGRLAPGCDADVLVMRRDSLELVHVFALGHHMVADGRLLRREEFLKTSDRRIRLEGQKEQ